MNNDLAVLRELARTYAEIAAQPIQQQRRDLWSDHNSLRPTRPPVLVRFFSSLPWWREFGSPQLRCADPFYRQHENELRLRIFHASLGDDRIIEPWYTMRAAFKVQRQNMWGLALSHIASEVEGGSWKFDPVIKDWSDLQRMTPPPHVIDEAATKTNLERLREAIGEFVTVDVDRGPLCMGPASDISTDLAQLRGLEEVMMDMAAEPEPLHRLLAFMRDGILANQAAAEAAGDIGLTSQTNQTEAYARELPPPRANTRNISRKQLWCFTAAQEFTLVSPAMHEEFLLRYQLPIMEKFGLVHYGCCEDLTHKIDMLRQIKNLRVIAIALAADVVRCAEQIGTDYVISWRPNPSLMVCSGFDEERIRRIISHGVNACRGCHFHVELKDIETLEGDVTRLARWVRIVREECDRC